MTTTVPRAMTIPAATLAAAIALGGLFAPAAAHADEYCIVNDSNMMGCGFSSLEQCKATVSGMNGECSPNPFLKENSIVTINRNAYGYAPYPIHGRHVRRGSITNTNN